MKMKNLLPGLIILAVMSCGDEDNVLTDIKSKDGINYKQSLKNWSALKVANGNSYTYSTSFASWTGYGSVTTLNIEKGIVISRTYEAYRYERGTKTITDTYSEGVGDLGTHDRGHPLLTIDDLYHSCAKEYLIADRDDNTVYFETGEAGLMASCGYVPKYCQDDCFRGVSINFVEWN
jgi:hypothetical protein